VARLLTLAIVTSLSLLGCDDTDQGSSAPTWSPAPMATVGVRFDENCTTS
jgi:hypothetical protein